MSFTFGEFKIVETKSWWCWLPKFLIKFLSIFTGFNLYASDKYNIKKEFIISGGNKDTIKPIDGNTYYITSGSTDKERQTVSWNFSSKYKNCEFIPMTTAEEGMQILSSISPFLINYFEEKLVTVICSGKTTVHFISITVENKKIYSCLTTYCSTLNIEQIHQIMKKQEITGSDIIFLGGLFSVATKKIYPKITSTTFTTCSLEYFKSNIHYMNNNGYYPAINEGLGNRTLPAILKNIKSDVPLVIGGRD